MTKKHSGAIHWRLQRLTAVALIPLTLWCLFSLLSHIGNDFAATRAWIAQPVTATLLGLWFITAFIHASLGLQVVIEDYIATAAPQKRYILIAKLVSIAAWLIGLISIIRIAIAS